jgi:P4 family phage/plasmid primase-like protien
MASNSARTNEQVQTSKLQRFLLKHLVQKGNAYTHTSLGKPFGSFYIPVEAINDFYRIYTDAIDSGEDVHLTEKHRHIAPIVIDLDMRFNLTDKLVRKYSNADVADILYIFCEELSKIFYKQTFHIYLLEKTAPIKQKTDAGVIIKDGIHIIIPDLVSKASVQYVLRNAVLQRLKDVFLRMGAINDIKDIVDEAVIERNNWMMYGSKKPNTEAYAVTRVFKWEGDQQSIIDISIDIDLKETYTLITTLSIRNKHDEDCIRQEVMDQVKEYDDNLEQRRKKMETSRAILSDEVTSDENECENYDMICALVDILSIERSENFNDWIRLGWCLRNIDHRLIGKWDEFSKKSPKYKPGECDQTWRHMRLGGGLGVGSLYMWAKQDNPERYSELLRKDLRRLIYESKSGTHTDVARVLHHMYHYEYVCSSIKNKTWFEFRNHRWVPSDSACSLRVRMSNEVWKEYVSAARDLSSCAVEATDPEKQERLHEAVQKLHGVANKLKTTSYKDNVLRECAEMFHVEKFEEKLDSNPALIGFENGVYDLDTLEFREGRPEDYMSFTTGNNYVKYDISHPYISGIKTYLAQVLTKPHIREYVMKLFSTFLHGAIKEQKFHIWTGSGCHAKDSQIMLYNGEFKMVQDIVIGDQLMGDDNQPRNVLQLFQGNAKLFKIIPFTAEPYIVNGDHVLSLVIDNAVSLKPENKSWVLTWLEYDINIILRIKVKTFDDEATAQNFHHFLYERNQCIAKDGDIIDITLNKYLECFHYIKYHVCLYQSKAIEFPENPVEVDPSKFGTWIRKGNSNSFTVTVTDDTEVCHFKNTGTYDLHSLPLAFIQKHNLLIDPIIPAEFKYNSVSIRQKLLNAILGINTCAKSLKYHIISSTSKIIQDIKYIARSLGYKCETKNGIYPDTLEAYFTLALTFKNDHINKYKFTVKSLEDDENFYGFELDSNHRYLDYNFIVHHNSNSKSKIIELFEKAFGDYCCKFPITLLTMKRAASNATTSELARAKGKRFASLQEPSEGEQINCGFMKELSGGDKIMARSLFKDPIEFVPQFKMLLLCNHLPVVPSDDGGTWRRIRVVEFTSRFVDNPIEENEFPIDTELSSKLENWKAHFMSTLLEYYKLYKTEGITEPEEVLACTREYKRQNDHLADFIHNCIDNKDTGFLGLNEAFGELKSWVKDDNIPVKIPTKAELEKYLAKSFGTKCVVHNNTKGFKGYIVRNRSQLTADFDPLED